MHYIRFLRPPKLTGSGSKAQLELVFTITTDLGDSFLFSQGPVEIITTAEVVTSSGTTTWSLTGRDRLEWKSGMRIAKPAFFLPPIFLKALASATKVEICISAKPALAAIGAHQILLDSTNFDLDQASGGLIMPAWVELPANGGTSTEVSTRRLRLGSENGVGYDLQVEEEIGESIARHIWDGGVMSLCAIAASQVPQTTEPISKDCMTEIQKILTTSQELSILELGCGVGILGIGVCAVLNRLRPAALGGYTVLLTDLEEAENRARANIARLQQGVHMPIDGDAQLLYENLDWEDAREGHLGPQVQSRPWDLIILSDCTYNIDVLPALVETLSALHSFNVTKATGNSAFSTKVFLATKPRHASEGALFDLMSIAGWDMQQKQTLSLPVIGSEAQSVEMYLFSKS